MCWGQGAAGYAGACLSVLLAGACLAVWCLPCCVVLRTWHLLGLLEGRTTPVFVRPLPSARRCTYLSQMTLQHLVHRAVGLRLCSPASFTAIAVSDISCSPRCASSGPANLPAATSYARVRVRSDDVSARRRAVTRVSPCSCQEHAVLRAPGICRRPLSPQPRALGSDILHARLRCLLSVRLQAQLRVRGLQVCSQGGVRGAARGMQLLCAPSTSTELAVWLS